MQNMLSSSLLVLFELIKNEVQGEVWDWDMHDEEMRLTLKEAIVHVTLKKNPSWTLTVAIQTWIRLLWGQGPGGGI